MTSLLRHLQREWKVCYISSHYEIFYSPECNDIKHLPYLLFFSFFCFLFATPPNIIIEHTLYLLLQENYNSFLIVFKIQLYHKYHSVSCISVLHCCIRLTALDTNHKARIQLKAESLFSVSATIFQCFQPSEITFSCFYLLPPSHQCLQQLRVIWEPLNEPQRNYLILFIYECLLSAHVVSGAFSFRLANDNDINVVTDYWTLLFFKQFGN